MITWLLLSSTNGKYYLQRIFQSKELCPKHILLEYDFVKDENPGTTRQRDFLNDSLARILIFAYGPN